MNKISLKILVVDDEEDIYLLFEQQFKKEIKANKLKFHYVRSAEEALSYLFSHFPHLILILADISMPGINGLELLRAIKRNYPQLMVYMITAYGDSDSCKKAWELGAEEIISKPIDFSYLKKMILNLMQRYESK